MNDDLTHHRLCVPTLFAWGSIIEPPTKHSSSGVCVFALWNSSRVDRERENSVSHGQTQGQKKKRKKTKCFNASGCFVHSKWKWASRSIREHTAGFPFLIRVSRISWRLVSPCWAASRRGPARLGLALTTNGKEEDRHLLFIFLLLLLRLEQQQSTNELLLLLLLSICWNSLLRRWAWNSFNSFSYIVNANTASAVCGPLVDTLSPCWSTLLPIVVQITQQQQQTPCGMQSAFQTSSSSSSLREDIRFSTN